MDNFILKGKNILAEHTTESKTESGIIIPNSAENKSPYFSVKKVGEEVEDERLKEGAVFFVNPMVASRQPGIEIDEETLTIFSESHVLGIIE